MQRDCMDVEGLGCIDTCCRRARDQVQVLERAQVGEIEDRAKIDIEAVGPLAGEHLHAIGKVVHGRLSKRAVVGC